MALNIEELYGYSPSDKSAPAQASRDRQWCPFINASCTKKFSGGSPNGTCTIKPATSQAVIVCPNRMYAGSYRMLHDIASLAFDRQCELVPGMQAVEHAAQDHVVAVFGRRWGHELHLPGRGQQARYYVDWVLALLEPGGTLGQFVAVEVQAMDTTGSYHTEREAHMRGEPFPGRSKSNPNWENVSKRILTQVITKGHILRREPLCAKGLFLVCPRPVHERIMQRLGGELYAYPAQAGTVTFTWYDLALVAPEGQSRELALGGRFTTTIDQVAHALSHPTHLPDAGVYEQAIRSALSLDE